MYNLVHSIIIKCSTNNYANDTAIIFVNMDDKGKVSRIDKVGHRQARFGYTLPRQRNRHF